MSGLSSYRPPLTLEEVRAPVPGMRVSRRNFEMLQRNNSRLLADRQAILVEIQRQRRLRDANESENSEYIGSLLAKVQKLQSRNREYKNEVSSLTNKLVEAEDEIRYINRAKAAAKSAKNIAQKKAIIATKEATAATREISRLQEKLSSINGKYANSRSRLDTALEKVNELKACVVGGGGGSGTC